MSKPTKEWGKGIPDYTDDDVLEGMELHAFCTNFVAESMQKEGYAIEGVILENTPTQVIANKAGERFFVIVAGGIYPYRGHISFSMKKRFAEFCKAKDVRPMFGSVGIMSHDEERASAGLALKNDGYLIKFDGFEDLSLLNPPTPDSEDYEGYCLEKIVEAYSAGRFDTIYDMFADDIQLHSQWVFTPLTGKKKLIEYYDGKGKAIRNSDTKISGHVVMISKKIKKTGNIMLVSKPGEVCCIIKQELTDKTNVMFVSPTFDKNKKISQLDLNHPALFNFVPYYAF